MPKDQIGSIMTNPEQTQYLHKTSPHTLWPINEDDYCPFLLDLRKMSDIVLEQYYQSIQDIAWKSASIVNRTWERHFIDEWDNEVERIRLEMFERYRDRYGKLFEVFHHDETRANEIVQGRILMNMTIDQNTTEIFGECKQCNGSGQISLPLDMPDTICSRCDGQKVEPYIMVSQGEYEYLNKVAEQLYALHEYFYSLPRETHIQKVIEWLTKQHDDNSKDQS